ncbi:MAG: hypothetical protein FJX77_11140, partial [Armatimonadetes bacterium]|nr:hypothetical protein [Armatimonadota bacterium]
MPVPIRALKRRYKINLALGRGLALHDLAIPLPFSTGNPLYDAALTDKLTPTRTLNEVEHLKRGWELVRAASGEETATLAAHSEGLLNDYRLLLALQCWDRGEEAATRRFLRSLPWHWRLGFPIAVINPAQQLFTGWRRAIRFRLVEEPRFPALRELYRELLAAAPEVTLLKYRETVHAAT